MAETVPDLAAALSAASQPDDVFPALLRFVAAAPTIVVVEDVHWADDATLDAIRYLSRRIPGVPAILLLTFRAEDVDATHPLRRILGGLGGSSNRRIELAPLSVDAVRRLAGVDDGGGGRDPPGHPGQPVLRDRGARRPAATACRRPSATRCWRGSGGCRPRPGGSSSASPSYPRAPSVGWPRRSPASEPDALVHAERSGVISGGPESRGVPARARPAGDRDVADRRRAGAGQPRGARRPAAAAARRAVAHRAPRRARAADRRAARVRPRSPPPTPTRRARTGRPRRPCAWCWSTPTGSTTPPTPACSPSARTRSTWSTSTRPRCRARRSAVSVAEQSQDPVVLAEALMVLSRIVFFAEGPMAPGRPPSRAVADPRRARRRRPARGGPDRAGAYPQQPRDRGHRRAARAPTPCGTPSARSRCATGCTATTCARRRCATSAAAGSPRATRAAPTTSSARIALGGAETRLETRVRGYVNAAGSAYRAGRLHDADRYVAAGLRLAADGEFAAGEYRLHLTSAAVAASQGDWDRAVAELRRLVTGPGATGRDGAARPRPAGPPAGPPRRPRRRRRPRRGAARPDLGRRQLRRRPAGRRAGGAGLAGRDRSTACHRRCGRRWTWPRMPAHRDPGGAVRVPAPGRARRGAPRTHPARGRPRWPGGGAKRQPRGRRWASATNRRSNWHGQRRRPGARRRCGCS